MSEYLRNPICNFTPLFNMTKKKKKIVSSSLFRIYGGEYKDFETRYMSELVHVNRFVSQDMKGFTHRLFIDNSIYSDKKIMKKLEKLDIELVLYTCPQFLLHNKYHYGTFGTLVRFFPMFDFPGNDAEIAWTSDIDHGNYDEVRYSRLGRLYDLYKMNVLGKIEYIADVDMFRRGKYYYHIYANRQFSKGNLDSNVLIKFFKDIDKYEERLSIYRYGSKKIDPSAGKFIYGVDEWFLDNNFYLYLVKKKVPWAIKLKNNIMVYLAKNVKRDNTDKEYMNFLKFVDPKHKYKTSYDGVKKLQRMMEFYIDNPSVKVDTDMITRIYLYFISVWGTPKEKYYGKDYLDVILSENYIGKFFTIEIKFFNIDQEDFFLQGNDLRTLPEKDIVYLKNIMGYV